MQAIQAMPRTIKFRTERLMAISLFVLAAAIR
jgi:hypothetical protein